jgi:tetratricopeptide (TPR) repeat protein
MDDSVIAVSERIRASDPRNAVALRRLAETYRAKNDTTKELQVLSQLAASDPTNIKLIQDVVNEYGAMHRAEQAVPLVRDLVQNNPGDPQLLNLAWVVYLAARDFQGAIDVGTEMVRVDTAAATGDYYARLVGAYSALNQPQKASEAAALGLRKFPSDPNLQLISIQALVKTGNLQAALDPAQKAVASNPKNANAWILLATIQAGLNQNDALATTLQSAKNNGADPGALSQIALKAGSDAYRACQGSKDIADCQRAIKFLQMSDQFQSSVDAKFLIGASAFSVGQTATTNANDRKSCELARTARDAFNLASLNLPAGGQKYPNEAAQLLTAIPQFTPAVDSEVKRFCK